MVLGDFVNLKRGTKMDNKFHYSAYWMAWSRVLGEINGKFIEISLTPVNNNWDIVRQEKIRVHFTSRSAADKSANLLPVDVFNYMKQNLDVTLINRLMNFDYMSNINWDLQRKHCNGGTPFNLCKK